MPKNVGTIDVSEITIQRRVRQVLLQTEWDESTDPPTVRVKAQFEYDRMLLGPDLRQIAPSKFDGVVTMTDAQLRANPNFASIYDAISTAAQDAKDAQDAAAAAVRVQQAPSQPASN